MMLSSSRSSLSSLTLLSLSIALLFCRVRCGQQQQAADSGTTLPAKIPPVNSTASPAAQDHKFHPENVLTSFLKLSQERSRVLDPVLSSNISVEEKWVSSVNFISSLTTLAIKASLPLSVSLTYQKDLSSECSASLLKILSGLRENQAWAFSCK